MALSKRVCLKKQRRRAAARKKNESEASAARSPSPSTSTAASDAVSGKSNAAAPQTTAAVANYSVMAVTEPPQSTSAKPLVMLQGSSTETGLGIEGDIIGLGCTLGLIGGSPTDCNMCSWKGAYGGYLKHLCESHGYKQWIKCAPEEDLDNLKCVVCPEAFTTKDAFTTHIMEAHEAIAFWAGSRVPGQHPVRVLFLPTLGSTKLNVKCPCCSEEFSTFVKA